MNQLTLIIVISVLVGVGVASLVYFLSLLPAKLAASSSAREAKLKAEAEALLAQARDNQS